MADTNSSMMDPASSPSGSGHSVGVRRVNNRPLMVALGVGALFCIAIAMVAAKRSEMQDQKAEAQLTKAKGSTASIAAEIAGSGSGVVAPAKPEPPVLPASGLLIADVDDPDAIPTPTGPVAQPLGPAPDSPVTEKPLTPEEQQQAEENRRIRQAKVQQLEEALRSGTAIKFESGTFSPSGSQPTARPAALTNAGSDPMLAALEQLQGGGGNAGGEQTEPKKAAGTDAYAIYAGMGEDRWRLNSVMEDPRTPYEIRAGSVVPALLISGINSDLPGQIVAQISQNVYDTATGRHLLLPQGSKLVGTYSSDVAYGQSRVMVAWQRITFPDGKAFDIGAMPGADGAGYSGLKDKVNNHYARVFGSAILMSFVVAGVTISQDDGGSGNQQRASDALSEALGQQLGQAMAAMIQKNLNIAPTLEIRPGFRLNVMLTKDLTFTKPYESFDYK